MDRNPREATSEPQEVDLWAAWSHCSRCDSPKFRIGYNAEGLHIVCAGCRMTAAVLKSSGDFHRYLKASAREFRVGQGRHKTN